MKFSNGVFELVVIFWLCSLTIWVVNTKKSQNTINDWQMGMSNRIADVMTNTLAIIHGRQESMITISNASGSEVKLYIPPWANRTSTFTITNSNLNSPNK